MPGTNTKVSSELWKSLGSFWGKLPLDDQGLIETIWDGYLDGFSAMYDDIDTIVSSTSISTMPGYVTTFNEYFDVIYSGMGLYSGMVNTELIDGDYNYYFNDGRMVMSISGLEAEYFGADGITWNTSGMAVDVNYTISPDGERMTFLDKPPIPRDLFQDQFYHGSLYAAEVDHVNPALFDVQGLLVGAKRELFTDRDYTTHKTYANSGLELRDLADHYKHLIWGLRYYKQSRPTLTNLSKGLSLAKGVPFAWEDGVIDTVTLGVPSNMDDHIITMVSGRSYTLPYGLSTELTVGEELFQFDPLISGINMYDWVNGSGIMYDMDIYEAQHKGILLYSWDQAISGFVQYNREFFDTYSSGILPAGMLFNEVEYDNDTRTFVTRHSAIKLNEDL